MSRFITFRESSKDEELQYFILQKAFPHYMGRISDYPPERSLLKVPIANYRLWIIFNGTLRGNVIPSFVDVYKEIENVFYDMADWYYHARIENNKKKYNKWSIK